MDSMMEEIARSPAEQSMHYIDYATLDGMLNRPEDLAASESLRAKLSKDNSVSGSAEKPKVRFLRMIENELERINTYVDAKVELLSTALFQLYRRASSAKGESNAEALDVVEHSAADVGENLRELGRFARINEAAFRQIVEKFDAVYGERVMSWLEARLSQQGFSNLCLDELLIKLSDVYCLLRDARKSGAQVRGARPRAWH